jgi:hypothetical protein
MGFLWVQFTSLTWWQMIIWVAYLIYFLGRSWKVWDACRDLGIKKGYKWVFFGSNPKVFRLYHLIRMILDIPPLAVGLLFPVIKAIFRIKLYEFKQPEDKKGEI